LNEPFCYRDERTVAAKEAADQKIAPFDLFQRTGALPMRLNDIYQLCSDSAAGVDPGAPWVTIPEYILYWLGAGRVAEYTRATHTGLVNLRTGAWDRELFELLDLDVEAASPLVHAGDVVGRLAGPLASLNAFREAKLIVPGCHDTASAIAGIPTSLTSTLYISSGTWSLVGTRTAVACTTREAFDAGYTNLGAATGDLLFHSVINSMWVLKQCMNAWAAAGRPWTFEDLIREAEKCEIADLLDMDAEPLMLDSDMPQRINNELERRGYQAIPDVPGNEPKFARVIFESLAFRYAAALFSLEKMLGRKLERIHMLGGANRNRLLVSLTEKRTGLPVEIGQTESTTIGSMAVQLAAGDANGGAVTSESIRSWAARLCEGC
jgi:rhamnulokinase